METNSKTNTKKMEDLLTARKMLLGMVGSNARIKHLVKSVADHPRRGSKLNKSLKKSGEQLLDYLVEVEDALGVVHRDMDRELNRD